MTWQKFGSGVAGISIAPELSANSHSGRIRFTCRIAWKIPHSDCSAGPTSPFFPQLRGISVIAAGYNWRTDIAPSSQAEHSGRTMWSFKGEVKLPEH